jgi:hypothetical protein
MIIPPKYSRLVRAVDDLDAKVGHKQRQCLQIIINEGDDPKPTQEKAVAEWMAAHPKAKARTIDDFDWIIRLVVTSWARPPDIRLPGPPSSNSDVFADEEERRKRFARWPSLLI